MYRFMSFLVLIFDFNWDIDLWSDFTATAIAGKIVTLLLFIQLYYSSHKDFQLIWSKLGVLL